MQFKAYAPQTLAFTDSTAPSLIACKRPPSPITGCHHFAGIWSPARTRKARLAVCLVSGPSWLHPLLSKCSRPPLWAGTHTSHSEPEGAMAVSVSSASAWHVLHSSHATTYPPWAFSSPLDCCNALLTSWHTSRPCPWWSVLHQATSVLENETDPVIPSFKLCHVSPASPACPGLSEDRTCGGRLVEVTKWMFAERMTGRQSASVERRNYAWLCFSCIWDPQRPQDIISQMSRFSSTTIVNNPYMYNCIWKWTEQHLNPHFQTMPRISVQINPGLCTEAWG